ncbi:hypothetical protein SASPL_155096 [Salvia splendens]|uniref:Carbonic anhydrase n=1 Tax=Salvia splendens TaxID=180675 RepID=A0A8X8W126_SALSN|nr:alpha carbonic anhydrase 1, chloroplastic-like [Salvia splendens]KAG6386205.1 hypothetical protein SASPL_155096 [Salvia splendens]
MSSPTLALFIVTISLLFVASSQQADGSIQFTYSGGTGPNMWGKINPNFSTCGSGKTQSPINILTDKAVLNKKLKPLIRSYGSCNVTLVNNKFNVGVRYPDHTGGVVVDGKMYSLKQMHWHSPSEHRINGKQYAAELHLVHVTDEGNVAVVAILFDYGHADPLLAKMQKALNELAYEVKRHEDSPITFGPFHPTEVRKSCHKYYRYVGSFTTPPCTQDVIWYILARVRSVSKAQVEALRAPLDLRCKNNARPCQPMNGRHVELYDEDV